MLARELGITITLSANGSTDGPALVAAQVQLETAVTNRGSNCSALPQPIERHPASLALSNYVRLSLTMVPA